MQFGDATFSRGRDVNGVAVHAGHLGAALDDGAGLGINVAVDGVEGGVIGAIEVNLEVSEEIVAGDEVVGVGETRGPGAAAAQMALAADRDDLAWRPPVGVRQPSERRVAGMRERDSAVAGVTIEREGRKGVSGGIDCGGVAARTAARKNIGLPCLAVRRKQGEPAVAGQFERAEVARTADHVGRPRSRLRHSRRHADRPNGPGVRIGLPGARGLDAMAEQALITRDVLGHRLTDVVAPPIVRRHRDLPRVVLRGEAESEREQNHNEPRAHHR